MPFAVWQNGLVPPGLREAVAARERDLLGRRRHFHAVAMTVEQHERMTELCRRIQGESNPAEFTTLVRS